MAATPRIAFLVAVAAALTWSLPGFDADTKAAGDAKALFEARCSVCHPSDRPKSKRKTREEWEKTVTRMIKVNGAAVTEDEARTIVEYLAKAYAP